MAKKSEKNVKDPLSEHQKDILEIKEMLRQVEKKIKIMTYIGYIKVLIFIIPVILGIMYIPPIFRDIERFLSNGNILPIEGGKDISMFDLLKFLNKDVK